MKKSPRYSQNTLKIMDFLYNIPQKLLWNLPMRILVTLAKIYIDCICRFFSRIFLRFRVGTTPRCYYPLMDQQSLIISKTKVTPNAPVKLSQCLKSHKRDLCLTLLICNESSNIQTLINRRGDVSPSTWVKNTTFCQAKAMKPGIHTQYEKVIFLPRSWN